ncbi:uncharacterized protein LOC131158381 isoform X4 [Malania oleifera]|uniref:uncharacterized protein LOC131158381 isoform X4 n=1 Tax=Malania oleifera TaxID=397392 RepID=UPI0025AE256E|nr:uncharacterized protein LOC131158381 isoform X4 [Malania oleifera]
MLTASTASLRLAVFASVPVSWFIIFPATDRRGDSAVADGSSGSSVSKEVSPDTSNIRGAKRWSINGCWNCAWLRCLIIHPGLFCLPFK